MTPAARPWGIVTLAATLVVSAAVAEAQPAVATRTGARSRRARRADSAASSRPASTPSPAFGPGPLAARRRRLLHRRSRRTRRAASADIVRYDAATGDAPRARRRRAARAAGPQDRARPSATTRGRPTARGCWCSPTPPRSGVSTRAAITGCSTSPSGRLRQLGGHGAGLVADVRQVLARRHARGLRARQQPLRRAARRRPRHRAHDDRLRHDHQRHVRLGLRRGARRARRLPLEPRRPAHRLLAVRHRRASASSRCSTTPTALYPVATRIPYPKPGTTNSAARIGVVGADGGETRWMQTPGDPRDSYLARLEWRDADTLAIQQLNRLQNQQDLLSADAAIGPRRRARSATDPRRGSTSWTRCAGWTRAARSCGPASATAGGTSTAPPPTARRPRSSRRSPADITHDRAAWTRPRSGSTSSPRPTAPPRAICIARGSTARARPSASRRRRSRARTATALAPGRAPRLPHLLAVRRAAGDRRRRTAQPPRAAHAHRHDRAAPDARARCWRRRSSSSPSTSATASRSTAGC